MFRSFICLVAALAVVLPAHGQTIAKPEDLVAPDDLAFADAVCIGSALRENPAAGSIVA